MNNMSFSDAKFAILSALRSAGKSEAEISKLSKLLDSDTGRLIIAAVIAATNNR